MALYSGFKGFIQMKDFILDRPDKHGWSVDYNYLIIIHDILCERSEDILSLEDIEHVLLAVNQVDEEGLDI